MAERDYLDCKDDDYLSCVDDDYLSCGDDVIVTPPVDPVTPPPVRKDDDIVYELFYGIIAFFNKIWARIADLFRKPR